jgi:hypothetical protein
MCTARMFCRCRKRPAVSGMSRRMQALFALKLLCRITKMWHLVTTTTTTTSTHIHCYSYYYYYRRRKLGGVWGKGRNTNWGENGEKGVCASSCLHRASIVWKTLFIVPTDTHYYKNHRILKQFKIIILAPTCFGSRRNHHQGAVLCLAKTTIWLFCARRYKRNVMVTYQPAVQVCGSQWRQEQNAINYS